MNERLFSEIHRLLQTKPTLLVAIDGDCASGKTTLAAALSACFPANVFHTDDFYLPLAARSSAFLSLPDGNLDYTRLENDVLKPLAAGNAFSYRTYDAHNDAFSAPIDIQPKPLNIIEGSYAMHPKISRFYDFTVFLEISRELQKARIESRNASSKDLFFSTWIPMEKRYSKAYGISQKCHINIYGG